MASRKSLCILLLAVGGYGQAQNLLIQEPLHIAGDTLRGVAFMGDEKLTGYAYFLSLFNEQGDSEITKLVWVESQQFAFALPLADDLATGYYQLQLTNYQNMAVTHAQEVPIIDQQGNINGLLERKSQSNTSLPVREYWQIDVGEDTPTQMTIQLNTALPLDDIASLSVTAYDLGQNPFREEASVCEGVADHQVATRGLTQWLTAFHVEGWLTSGDEPLVDETVTFADPDDVAELRYTTTNENGKFGFYNVDFDGEKDIYVAPLNGELDDFKILFSASREAALRPLESCSQPFDWQEQQLERWVERRLLDRKVTEYYYEQNFQKRELSLADPRPLFDDADHTVLLDDYVSFGSVKEVIKEVVPYVHLSRKRLRVFSTEQRRTFDGYPLLLLNGIPVSQDSVMLNLDVARLHSVQVLNTRSSISSHGRIANAGMVSFVTRDPNERPTSVEATTIEGFNEMRPYAPRKNSPVAPYFPSVLAWLPEVPLGEDGYGLRFDIPAYDTSIVVEVVSQLSNGHIIREQKVVEVKRRPR